MSDFGNALEKWIVEARLGDKNAEVFLRQRFNIPAHKTIDQFFDEVAASEFGVGAPFDGSEWRPRS